MTPQDRIDPIWVAGGMTDEADEFIKMVMADMMDQQLSLPD